MAEDKFDQPVFPEMSTEDLKDALTLTGKIGVKPLPLHFAERNFESDLQKIFRMQQDLNDYIAEKKGIDFNDDLDKWINNWINAIIGEATELRDETNWRWWKVPKEHDMDAIREEVIDLWHFLISLSICVGLNADDVMSVYEEKHQVNIDRQDGKTDKEGYV